MFLQLLLCLSYQKVPCLSTAHAECSMTWIRKVDWINLQSELAQLIWSKAGKGAPTWIPMTELWVQWHLTNKQISSRDGVIIPAILETGKHFLNWAWASKTYHVYVCWFKKQANPHTVEKKIAASTAATSLKELCS